MAVKIKNNTKTFNQTGKKMTGGNEKIDHIMFIPPAIEKGNKNIIPVIIPITDKTSHLNIQHDPCSLINSFSNCMLIFENYNLLVFLLLVVYDIFNW